VKDLPEQLQRAFDTIKQLDEQDVGVRFSFCRSLLSLLSPLHGCRAALTPLTPRPPALSAELEQLVGRRLAAFRSDSAAAPPLSTAAGAAAPGGRADGEPPEEPLSLEALLAKIEADSGVQAQHAAQKCILAGECYDLVDSLIVRLDRDLTACDEEVAKAREAQLEKQAAAAAARIDDPKGRSLGGGRRSKKGPSHLKRRFHTTHPLTPARQEGRWTTCSCRRARRRPPPPPFFPRAWTSLWTRTSPRTARASGCRLAT
jgi:hypothetical protein